MNGDGTELKSLMRIVSGSAIIASMCCLPSVVLVMFGLAVLVLLQHYPIHYTGARMVTAGLGRQC